MHTLALLVFLPLIPHTKHLHLVLSPITVFLQRPGFSHIPPLAGDEDFGLDTGKDVTRIDALQAYTCVECGRCTEHCPAYNTGKVLNPKEIVLGLRRYLNEEGPRERRAAAGKHISAEAAFQCTTCGACEYQCPVGIQHLPIIIGLRRGAVNTGKWEDEHGTKLFLDLERNGNSLGFAAAERQKFIEKNELPDLRRLAGVLPVAGLHGLLRSAGPRDRAGAGRACCATWASPSACCARRSAPATRRAAWATTCSSSSWPSSTSEQLRRGEGAEDGLHLPALRPHHRDGLEGVRRHLRDRASQRIAGALRRAASRATGGREKVVFHDPCYLGRYRGVYDEPREVIARSAEVVDPPRARQRGFCCGAGGGQMFLGEEKGKRVNVERAEELVATGAAVIGTACPFCQTMFRDALGAAAPQAPPKLLDIVQIAGGVSSRCGQRLKRCYNANIRGRVAQLAEQLTLNQ